MYADKVKSLLADPRELVVGRPAPAIEGPALGGGTLRLGDLRGRVAVPVFWGTRAPQSEPAVVLEAVGTNGPWPNSGVVSTTLGAAAESAAAPGVFVPRTVRDPRPGTPAAQRLDRDFTTVPDVRVPPRRRCDTVL
jgi:hypothetical protein